jgi:hypothetical protein
MVKKKTQSQAAEAAVALPTSETGKGKGKTDGFLTSGQQAAGKTPAVVQSPGAAGSLGADSKGTKQHAKDEIDKIFAGKRKASAAEGQPCNEASDPKELRELAEQVQEARSKVRKNIICCCVHQQIALGERIQATMSTQRWTCWLDVTGPAHVSHATMSLPNLSHIATAGSPRH